MVPSLHTATLRPLSHSLNRLRRFQKRSRHRLHRASIPFFMTCMVAFVRHRSKLLLYHLTPRSLQNYRPRPSVQSRALSNLQARPEWTRTFPLTFFCALFPMYRHLLLKAKIQSVRMFHSLYPLLHLHLVCCLITIIADRSFYSFGRYCMNL